MTAEIINQRHFWKDIGSSIFLIRFFNDLIMVGLIFFEELNYRGHGNTAPRLSNRHR